MSTNHAVTQGNPLTERELEIITLIAEGDPNKTIAAKLGLSPATIKSNLVRIGKKLGTGDRAGIVATAIRTGQLYPEITEPVVPSRGRADVICQCARCQRQLAAAEGFAATIANRQWQLQRPA